VVIRVRPLGEEGANRTRESLSRAWAGTSVARMPIRHELELELVLPGGGG